MPRLPKPIPYDEYELRYTPDGLPLGVYRSEGEAFRAGKRRAEKFGMGPYLVYAFGSQGETYIGEAG